MYLTFTVLISLVLLALNIRLCFIYKTCAEVFLPIKQSYRRVLMDMEDMSDYLILISFSFWTLFVLCLPAINIMAMVCAFAMNHSMVWLLKPIHLIKTCIKGKQ